MLLISARFVWSNFCIKQCKRHKNLFKSWCRVFTDTSIWLTIFTCVLSVIWTKLRQSKVWGKIPLWPHFLNFVDVKLSMDCMIAYRSLYSDMKASCSIFSFYKCNERRLQTEYSLWDIHLLYLEQPFLLFARFFKSSTLQLTDFMVETIEGA